MALKETIRNLSAALIISTSAVGCELAPERVDPITLSCGEIQMKLREVDATICNGKGYQGCETRKEKDIREYSSAFQQKGCEQ